MKITRGGSRTAATSKMERFVIIVNKLILADVFGIFCNKCIEMYELDPAHFLSAPD